MCENQYQIRHSVETKKRVYIILIDKKLVIGKHGHVIRNHGVDKNEAILDFLRYGFEYIPDLEEVENKYYVSFYTNEYANTFNMDKNNITVIVTYIDLKVARYQLFNSEV